jgi:hypothetical protein
MPIRRIGGPPAEERSFSIGKLPGWEFRFDLICKAGRLFGGKMGEGVSRYAA